MTRIARRFSRRIMVLAHDLAMIPVAWFGAYWLRFNLESIPSHVLSEAVDILPVLIVIQALAFWHFGLYRGIWRFASMPDLLRIGKAVVVGTLIATALVFLISRLQDVPRSVFPLYAILLAFFTGGPRFLYRWYKDHRLILRAGQRVLIVGAGSGGEMLVRDLLRNQAGQYQPVGFVDDDPQKRGKEIHGFRVFGASDRIPDWIETHAIDLVMIAIPSAKSKDMRRIVRACEKGGVPFRTLPGTQDIASGRAAIQTLREVSIDDLLGREPVSLDWKGIQTGLAGRTVMVTGGGGSIGAELCRQIARLEPKRVVLFESSEFNLYEIERELKQRFPALEIAAYLGDVSDAQAVEQAFNRYKPDVVFHAAAYKHVPMLEGMVRSAVRNNVFGTRCMADAADRHQVTTFVLISTDKAVNPTNVMGATKRMAEIYCQNLDTRSQTRFITVRFGNVLGSAGSVVPLFREQIARGGPVTVTHPEVTRFFMTIPEACQLIMQAGVMGRGGEIFVLDMGEPIKIGYLAEQMIRLAGKVPEEDIEITYTGLRPGEKLYEELFHEKETMVGTGHDKILLARVREVPWSELQHQLGELAVGVERCEEKRLLQALRGLIPEFEAAPAEPGKVIALDSARK